MTQRMVVVGGDATGMSAASQAKRRATREGRELDVVVVERGHHVSYSACGIPYWVSGDVADADALVARTVAEHRANGLDVRLRTEATGIDLAAGEVEVRSAETGKVERIGYDDLVLGTGAVPVRPRVPGVQAAGVLGVQTLDDGQLVIDYLHGLERRGRARRAVVVGGGYIGVEMAEALTRHGLAVTVVDMAEEPMGTLDPDMGALVHREMECMGIDVRTRTPVEAFLLDADGAVRAVAAGGAELPADVVVLGLGVKPATALAADTDLPLGRSGGLLTDLRMRVTGQEHVWAGGDCVEVRDLVSEEFVHVPLGTHANKHGRVIGTNLGGGYATFPGVVRTAVSKVCSLEIARTGLTEADARRTGFRYVVVHVESTTTAGYMPNAEPMTVKALAEEGSGRLLGVQIVGRSGAAKRIDACAVALWNRMTVEEMTALDLAYAPPYAPVWDPVLVAARKATDALAAVSR